MLRSLHLKDVGPAARFDLDLGERLNVLTGDNGLGKSFLLDVAWWALTGTWVDRVVLPQRGREESAEIVPHVAWGGKEPPKRTNVDVPKFNRVLQQWGTSLTHRERNQFQPRNDIYVPAWLKGACPVLYLRTNGAIALWDPTRHHHVGQIEGLHGLGVLDVPPLVFDEATIWNGLERGGNPVCNGLIQDWVTWQLEAQSDEGHPFHLLSRVLAKLSHPDELMKPGKPVRLYLNDPRKIPTIELPYDTIPVVHASAGMKRILGIAYLVTWMWTEHLQASAMIGWNPASRVVVLFEEPETNLHPKWQRHIVPALLDVLGGLSPEMHPQLLVTTHSPMVLASLEPHFDERRDKLFLLEMEDGPAGSGVGSHVEKAVVLHDVPWAKRGDAGAWLTSFMGLEQARSIEAERAIHAAYDFMASRTSSLPEGLRTEDEIDRELRRLLADQDKFWPRWVVRREQKSA